MNPYNTRSKFKNLLQDTDSIIKGKFIKQTTCNVNPTLTLHKQDENKRKNETYKTLLETQQKEKLTLQPEKLVSPRNQLESDRDAYNCYKNVAGRKNDSRSAPGTRKQVDKKQNAILNKSKIIYQYPRNHLQIYPSFTMNTTKKQTMCK